jgi:hypothetical protein
LIDLLCNFFEFIYFIASGLFLRKKFRWFSLLLFEFIVLVIFIILIQTISFLSDPIAKAFFHISYNQLVIYSILHRIVLFLLFIYLYFSLFQFINQLKVIFVDKMKAHCIVVFENFCHYVPLFYQGQQFVSFYFKKLFIFVSAVNRLQDLKLKVNRLNIFFCDFYNFILNLYIFKFLCP